VIFRWLAVLLLLCSGCTAHHRDAGRFTDRISSQKSVELVDTVFFPQDKYQCGPAALATALQSSGLSIQPSELVSKIYLPGRHGSLQTEIISTSRSYGRLAYRIKPDINALIRELQVGYPVLVLQNLGLRFLPVWHYAVVIGYSHASSEIILRSGTTQRETLTTKRFIKTWAAANNWGLILLKPGQLPAENNVMHFLKAVADLEETGQTEASLTGYETAVSHWPENQIAWFGLGNAHYRNKLYSRAETAYRQTLVLNTDHLPAINNLAITLTKLDRRKAAQTLIKKTLARISTQSPMYQTLLQTQQEITSRQPYRNSD
jgi:tetratricopeptide (TPR) repeat protein